MKYYSDSNKLIEKMEKEGVNACDVLTEENGCVAGCKAGFTFYRTTEYKKPGVHKDQEGFLVLEGRGRAKFGKEEFDIYPGLIMIAPPGVTHTIKKNEDSCDVKVFWFHSAV